jgi:DNA polymerase
MFDEKWKLKAFEAYDAGTGPDTYKQAYARSFQVHIDTVTKDDRQVGKVEELAFAFEGGVGACVTAAGTYSVDLYALAEAVWPTIPADVMDKSEWMWDKFGRGSGLDKRTYLGLNSLKEMWRIAHPRHQQGWRDMKDAAIAAIENPGKVYSIPSKWIMFRVEEDWLLMRLPSGRRIRYYKPLVEYDYVECSDCVWAPCPAPDCASNFDCPVCLDHEAGKVPSDPNCAACGGKHKIRNPRSARITYLGIDTDTRRWMRTGTYGGKLTENGAQGGSSDLLRHGVMALEKRKYWPVMTVHDEVVCEVDLEFGSLEEATEVFVDKPLWAEGLPIAAEGWSGKRYRKE